MNNKKVFLSIKKYLLIFSIIFIITGFFVNIIFITYQKNLIEKKGSKFIKQTEIKLQKEKIKILVNHTINLLKNNPNILNKLQNIYIDKKNYIFIYKLNYPLNENILNKKYFAKMLVNINRPDLIGKNLSINKKDIKNKEFRKEMITKLIKNSEAFVRYYYKNPLTNKITLKISYFKYYKPLNIIVASGTYLNETNILVKNYQNTINKIIQKTLIIFIIAGIVVLLVMAITFKLIFNKIKEEILSYQKALKKEANKVKHQLYFDELTKLENRQLLVKKIERGVFNCLIVVDIDNFRNINQFYGAKVGDEYLKQFANLLKQFRKTQFFAMSIFRIGSDEFALAIRHSTHEKTKQIAKNLDTFLQKHSIIIENDTLDISTTIVYAGMPNALKKALITLSIAKKSYKSLCSYDEIKNISTEEEYFKMKKLLKTAIEKNQVTPYAQAIVNREGKVIKYELLMRIVTEDKVIPPYFLEYAKKAKLYNKLSLQMLEKCFKFIEKTDILCSINLDLEDITNEETITKLKEWMRKVKKPVVFEMLEYNSMSSYTEFEKFFTEFRKEGALFAIDDFGAGFSNYKEVISLKPDYIKLDGSLIKNILDDKDNLILVSSIVSLAMMLHIKTTAEFVENEKIFKKLTAIGIEEFQGYYFAKPMPLEELKEI